MSIEMKPFIGKPDDVTEKSVLDWVVYAKPGDWCLYRIDLGYDGYTGELPRQTVGQMRDALSLARSGLVNLFQRKRGDTIEYLAQKRQPRTKQTYWERRGL